MSLSSCLRWWSNT